MSFVLALFMIIITTNALLFEDFLVIPFSVFFFFNFLVAPFLLWKNRFEPAKWFFAITPIVEVIVISLVNGAGGGDKFYLMTTGMIPIMIFRKKWIGLIFFQISIGGFLLLSWLQANLSPLIVVDKNILLCYEYNNYLVICFIIYLFTRYFKNDTERIEQELVFKNALITEKHKEITDSINYAERIQKSFMASHEILDENLKNYFLYFNPKEAVSGDFYWATSVKTATTNRNKDVFILAVADSTGHGVPGAIMSILNITCLENAVKDGQTSPAEILNHTRKNIIERLKKDGSEEAGKDGMDVSLLVFDLENNILHFALANNPLWLFRPDAANKFELIEFAPDKMPVGRHDNQHKPFTHQKLNIRKGDILFLFTDGFPDQFGGPNGKKFKYAQLKKLLSESLNLESSALKNKVQRTFESWKGDLEQTDDVCLMGIWI